MRAGLSPAPAILPGITRLSIMQLAKEAGLTVEERLFTVDEACGAAEAFFTSASTFVVPVVAIDGRQSATANRVP